VRRLAGAARLLVNHVDEGLLSGMLAAVKAGPTGPAGILRVAGDGYWLDHYDLTSGRVHVPGALIGPGRAGELAVNIVLPFVLAWAERHGDIALADAAVLAYRRHPAVPSYGQLRSLSAALGSRTAAGARRQQGMLHLFRRYCRKGGCASGQCPLS
jgi:hypothetical protein